MRPQPPVLLSPEARCWTSRARRWIVGHRAGEDERYVMLAAALWPTAPDPGEPNDRTGR